MGVTFPLQTEEGLGQRGRPAPQAAATGSVARRPDDRAAWRQLIAVASGKGGVGKSNVAAGLAILLSASGARVALVDADVGLGNLDVLMGVNGASTLAEVAAGRKSIEQVLTRLPCGARLAAGGSGLKAPAALWRSAVLEGLSRIRGSFDLVLLDCASGVGSDVMDFCAVADHVLVVTTPEPTALTDAYGMIKSLTRGGHSGRLSVLVNMASNRAEARACQARLASVAGRFLGITIYDAGHVVADPKVPAAVRKRRHFVLEYPRSPASRCLVALAVKLWPGSALLDRPSSGLARGISRWFR